MVASLSPNCSITGTRSFGNGKLNYPGNGKQKYPGNGKQKYPCYGK